MSLTQPIGGAPQAHGSKVTPQTLLDRKQRRQPITALTAYDYPTARLVDQAGIDVVLVGDSLAMAVLGHPDTLAVTMDEMLHHTRAVRRGVQNAMLLGDMPYGSYHTSTEDALRNAMRFMKEAGAEAVKLEGGASRAGLIRSLTDAEVPVVGHIGLTPQSIHRMGGYHVQGRSEATARQLCDDALAIQDAGCIAVVLEGVPRELAAHITSILAIPTIGIGAGPDCDGQILVFHDLFDLTFAPKTKFVRRFADASSLIRHGLEDFRRAVTDRAFPDDTESYHLPASLLDHLGSELGVQRDDPHADAARGRTMDEADQTGGELLYSEGDLR
jgi:3-methyl-2-oxobutanoate hydroxymethyltransferase